MLEVVLLPADLVVLPAREAVQVADPNPIQAKPLQEILRAKALQIPEPQPHHFFEVPESHLLHPKTAKR